MHAVHKGGEALQDAQIEGAFLWCGGGQGEHLLHERGNGAIAAVQIEALPIVVSVVADVGAIPYENLEHHLIVVGYRVVEHGAGASFRFVCEPGVCLGALE